MFGWCLGVCFGWLFASCQALVTTKLKKLHLSSAVFSHKLHSRIFWEVLKVVWIVSGSVWRVSLDCLVESTLRQVIPTTKRLLYKSTVFSTSALFLHFSRVAEWCLEGVWRVSGGCLKGVWECVVSDYDCLAKVLVINMLDQAQKLGLKAPASSCALSPSQLWGPKKGQKIKK